MLVGAQPIYNPHVQSVVDGDIISQLSFGSYMRPQETIHKDRTYHQPDYRLRHKAEGKGQRGKKSPYSVFESYGRFQKDNVAKPFTQYRIEGLQSDSRVGTAKSNCIKLTPGKAFILSEHPVASMNERWQVVTVSHYGKMPQALEEESDGGSTTLTNDLSFIPGRQEWRPPYHYKPLADGDEVATVVGPSGEEIYVNKDGAIRVHFHWNRYDEADDNASCWVRVAQGWNGSGYGFLATPRIGQEVIISYLNGDIDRPIVTGCTYNDLNKPPLDLPAEKTRTTFKTRTHKGKGFNELRFEDQAENEEIYIHAQRDMNTHVLHDETLKVDNKRTHHIKNIDDLRVENERRVLVQQDHSVTTEQSLHVRADNRILVNANNEIHVRSNVKLVIDAGAELTLQAAGHFIKIDAGGVTSSSALNMSSGAPTKGSGWQGKAPELLNVQKRSGGKVEKLNAEITPSLKEVSSGGLCVSCMTKAALNGATMIVRGNS